ncbi:MAG: selenocysteine-specific translation elongation factor [Desulfotomaculum sp.]|nr:selenocysteine-specific translation elongation factor [Desulfotomaculum sp.]
MKHIIIGTAGHVDHGKTMLIKALTGIDTDRLREEKERGISIELGFASLTLPSGRRAGIVDVPGHERFIKNMLAGVSGIDLVLLIIAADEGVMPQTREHFDILQLLQVRKGIVVLTKTDLVEPEWLELVKEEVREFLVGTTMQDAPLLAVSSVTGEGIKELLKTIDKMIEHTEERNTAGFMRLPVDRVFSVTGFGTVVTGTMVSGEIFEGDEVEIMPSGLKSRVRGLQVHGTKVNRARAGQRVAINLAGVEVEDIKRGDVVTVPGTLTPSFRLDAKLYLLEHAVKTLKNRARLRLHIGTDEIMSRVILLDRDELQPGESAYVQFQVEEKTVASKGDRFVIRTYSPMYTIGGGVIIDPAPGKHKRFRPEVINELVTKEKGTPEELVLQFVSSHYVPTPVEDISIELHLSPDEIAGAVQKLVEKQKIKQITADNKNVIIPKSRYYKWTEEVTGLVSQYHKKYPLREGYPKEELRSRLFSSINVKEYQHILQAMQDDGIIILNPQTITLPNFNGEPTGKTADIIKKIETLLKDKGFKPPKWKEILKRENINEEDGGEYLSYLNRTGKIIKISDEIYFHREILDEARKKIIKYLKENGSITISEARDLLGTTRKYALPLMEYFDRQRITRRIEDNRVLGVKGREME